MESETFLLQINYGSLKAGDILYPHCEGTVYGPEKMPFGMLGISKEIFDIMVKQNLIIPTNDIEALKAELKKKMAELDEIHKEIDKISGIQKPKQLKPEDVPNGTNGILNTPSEFGDGFYAPDGMHVKMFNNIPDEYENICIKMVANQKTYIVRFKNVTWEI